MDFEPNERQRYWRDRVRQFIESHVRPRNAEYQAEQASGERWKVLQVVEEEKARADYLARVTEIRDDMRAATEADRVNQQLNQRLDLLTARTL